MISKVFVDTDILLDLFLERTPFATDSAKLFNTVYKNRFMLFTSTLIVANIYYIVNRKMDRNRAKQCVKTILDFLHVLPIDRQSLQSAFESDFADFEDAIQHTVAKTHNCDIILTRNIKDYTSSTLPVSTAGEYLLSLS